MRSVVITIANQKSGVGKATTAVTLATGLADVNYPVVLIDCDPQGNTAPFLGLDPNPGLYRLVVENRSLAEVVQHMSELGYPKLGLIAGDNATVDLETLLRTSARFDPTWVFSEALRPLRANQRNGKPTVIILDTAPSLSSVQLAALNVADWLIIPTSPEFASETGIGALAEAVDELKSTGASLSLLGVLPTMVDARSREHRQTVKDLIAAFPGLILPPVRRLIALAEAPRAGVPIWLHAPNSEAAQDYAAVLKEVIKRAGL